MNEPTTEAGRFLQAGLEALGFAVDDAAERIVAIEDEARGVRYARTEMCAHPDEQREYVPVNAFQSTCQRCGQVELHPAVGGASPTPVAKTLVYEAGHRAALHMASKRIRALPKVHGPDIAISDEALSEREAIADFIDELSG